MALLSPKVIAQVSVRSSGELAVASWDWIMRADGKVLYRLGAVNARRERNPWILVARLSAADLDAIGGDSARAAEALDAIVRRHGHRR